MSDRPVRILVTAASRHGATAEIAVALAAGLADPGAGPSGAIEAVAVPVDQRPDPAGFDAVLLGSAVYAGHWIDSAREYATTHAAVLRQRPVWLFSSGPIGEPPFPSDEPYAVQPLVHLIEARGHRVFPGRLEKDRLSFGERAMVTAMRAPLGDFRDWDAVRAWAAEVAGLLTATSGAPSVPG